MARRKRRHHHRESLGVGRVLITTLVSLVVLGVGAMVAAWWWLDSAAEPFAADRPETAQTAEVGLVLGAAPFLDDGRPNRFFERMNDAGTQVFVSGPYGHGAAGIDSDEDMARLPNGFTGGIWTNRIDRIGQKFNRAAPPNAP